VPFGDRKTKI